MTLNVRVAARKYKVSDMYRTIVTISEQIPMLTTLKLVCLTYVRLE